MARRYIVDLRGLNPVERKAAYDQIDRFSFMAVQIVGETGLEGVDVTWDSSEDFPTSPIFPRGCPYREVM